MEKTFEVGPFKRELLNITFLVLCRGAVNFAVQSGSYST